MEGRTLAAAHRNIVETISPCSGTTTDYFSPGGGGIAKPNGCRRIRRPFDFRYARASAILVAVRISLSNSANDASTLNIKLSRAVTPSVGAADHIQFDVVGPGFLSEENKIPKAAGEPVETINNDGSTALHRIRFSDPCARGAVSVERQE